MNPVFIVVGLAAAIGIFISPMFGLALTLILIPISTQLTMGGSFLGIFTMVTPIKIIGTLTFISTLIHYGGRKGVWDFLKKPQMRFFLFFLIWIFISGITQSGWASRENFTMFISNAILGVTILILIQDVKRFRLMLWLIVISIFFICLQTVLSYLGINRAGGTGYGPNEFAIAILPFIAITFYMALAEKNGALKIILIGIITVIFLALISTVSRGGIVGLGGMLLILTLKSKRKILTIIAVCIVVVLFINTMPQNLRERFSKTQVTANARGIGDGDIDSTTRRYYLAQAGWRIFLSHPLFGIGVGNYYYENRNYAPVSPGRAHNMYLEMMAELGIIGIILFLGIIFYTFKSLNRIIKSKSPLNGYAKGFYIGLIGFLIAGIFLHAQQDRVLWFLIFMSAALERIYEKNYI
ncbi:MAG: O-antigen ligase family protein [Candidatus Omnitrophica bacterium]|nr:O-antigen ligase family protein [Candidatus Omnitrophota bacterium]